MFMKLLKNRRSIRQYKNKAVEKEKIETLIEAALRSPSSRSLNPWEFIVVTDKQKLQELSISKPHGAGFLKDAPLGIVVIADPEKCDVWVEDSSIASILIQLTAESIGLKSCWIQIRKRFYKETTTANDRVLEILDIPEKYSVESIIAIGYPDETKDGHNAEYLAYDKVHYEKYQTRC